MTDSILNAILAAFTQVSYDISIIKESINEIKFSLSEKCIIKNDHSCDQTPHYKQENINNINNMENKNKTKIRKKMENRNNKRNKLNEIDYNKIDDVIKGNNENKQVLVKMNQNTDDIMDVSLDKNIHIDKVQNNIDVDSVNTNIKENSLKSTASDIQCKPVNYWKPLADSKPKEINAWAKSSSLDDYNFSSECNKNKIDSLTLNICKPTDGNIKANLNETNIKENLNETNIKANSNEKNIKANLNTLTHVGYNSNDCIDSFIKSFTDGNCKENKHSEVTQTVLSQHKSNNNFKELSIDDDTKKQVSNKEYKSKQYTLDNPINLNRRLTENTTVSDESHKKIKTPTSTLNIGKDTNSKANLEIKNNLMKVTKKEKTKNDISKRNGNLKNTVRTDESQEGEISHLNQKKKFEITENVDQCAGNTVEQEKNNKIKLNTLNSKDIANKLNVFIETNTDFDDLNSKNSNNMDGCCLNIKHVPNTEPFIMTQPIAEVKITKSLFDPELGLKTEISLTQQGATDERLAKMKNIKRRRLFQQKNNENYIPVEKEDNLNSNSLFDQLEKEVEDKLQ